MILDSSAEDWILVGCVAFAYLVQVTLQLVIIARQKSFLEGVNYEVVVNGSDFLEVVLSPRVNMVEMLEECD